MIRPATIDELPLLSELARRSKAHWGYSAAFMQACLVELTVSESQLADTFVKQFEDRIAGFYTLSEIGAKRAELDFLFIDPWAMRRGFGRELVSHACRRASRLRYRTIVIQGDPHAHAFYAATGAVRVGERASDSIPGRMLPLYELASDPLQQEPL